MIPETERTRCCLQYNPDKEIRAKALRVQLNWEISPPISFTCPSLTLCRSSYMFTWYSN